MPNVLGRQRMIRNHEERQLGIVKYDLNLPLRRPKNRIFGKILLNCVDLHRALQSRPGKELMNQNVDSLMG
jgi:hypothetical protein